MCMGRVKLLSKGGNDSVLSCCPRPQAKYICSKQYHRHRVREAIKTFDRSTVRDKGSKSAP